jgi:hypothetical protein
MRACKRGDYIYYFYDTGGKPRKEIALGKNYAEAVKKWAELEIDAKPTHNEVITFRYVANRYIKEVIPTKTQRTQEDNLEELQWLFKFFDNPTPRLKKLSRSMSGNTWISEKLRPGRTEKKHYFRTFGTKLANGVIPTYQTPALESKVTKRKVERMCM